MRRPGSSFAWTCAFGICGCVAVYLQTRAGVAVSLGWFTGLAVAAFALGPWWLLSGAPLLLLPRHSPKGFWVLLIAALALPAVEIVRLTGIATPGDIVLAPLFYLSPLAATLLTWPYSFALLAWASRPDIDASSAMLRFPFVVSGSFSVARRDANMLVSEVGALLKERFLLEPRYTDAGRVEFSQVVFRMTLARPRRMTLRNFDRGVIVAADVGAQTRVRYAFDRSSMVGFLLFALIGMSPVIVFMCWLVRSWVFAIAPAFALLHLLALEPLVVASSVRSLVRRASQELKHE